MTEIIGLGNRLRELRERKGLSQRAIADRFSVSQQSWGGYEKGKAQPPISLVQSILVEYDVSGDWLLTGDGEMRRRDVLVASEEEPAPYIAESRQPTVRVPVYDVALSAGDGEDDSGFYAVDALVSYDEVFFEWLRDECRMDPHRAFYAPVRGDSMEDRLFDGDWILGETQDYIDREGIFAMVLNGMLFIKHIQQGPRPGEISLVSQNAIYPPRIVSEEQGDSLHIIGRYVRRVTR